MDNTENILKERENEKLITEVKNEVMAALKEEQEQKQAEQDEVNADPFNQKLKKYNK